MEVIERYSFKFEGILEVKTSQKKRKRKKERSMQNRFWKVKRLFSKPKF